jgi:hypothetical protein
MTGLLYKYYNDTNHIIYHLILLTGIVIGIVRFKKMVSGSRIFLLLLAVTLLSELAAYYCAVKYHDNRFVYNFFNLLQFSLICRAFYVESRLRTTLIIFALYLLFTVINTIFYQPLLTASNTNGLLMQHLLTIVLYFTYLVLYFKKTTHESLTGYPLFWTGLGWLIFSVSSIVAFGYNNLVASGTAWDDISVWVKKISNYLLYLSFIPAFLSPQKTLNDIAAGK